MSPARPQSSRRKILIVDDHPVVRHGLRELLAREPDLDVCGEAESVPEAMRMVESLSPDLVLVDLTLKGRGGIDLIKRIRDEYPAVRTLVVSLHEEGIYAQRALQAGARGYINKGEAITKALEAVRAVLEGGVYLSPETAARMPGWASPRERGETQSPVAALSDRELEVFEALGRGLGTREIAGQLHLSVKTIESHRENIKRKLGLSSNTELLRHSFSWVLEGH